jgi:hypothetical protein
MKPPFLSSPDKFGIHDVHAFLRLIDRIVYYLSALFQVAHNASDELFPRHHIPGQSLAYHKWDGKSTNISCQYRAAAPSYL